MTIHAQAFCGQNLTKLEETIGNTPLLKLVEASNGSRLFLKLEQFNPTGSAKVRMAKSMLDEAEQKGFLKPKGWVVESTSGNTGVGLAMLCAERGYRFTALVDNHAAIDKINNMKAFGAEVICVSDEGSEDLATAVRDNLAENLATNQGAFWTAQHRNFANSRGYIELAQELVNSVGTNITHLVTAVGTGGAICGTTRALRDLGCHHLASLGVEPVGSVIFGGPGKPYHQSGTGTPAGAEIGAVIEYALIDEGITVTDKQAFNTARYLAKNNALLVGGSAGGVIYQALQKLKHIPKNSNMVVLVCDGGEKYMDTVYNDEWMQEHHLIDKGIDTELDEVFTQLAQTQGA
jgi:cystathionine beta-synthase